MRKIPSWNFETRKDCFGNRGPTSKDHVFPKRLKGANSRKNWQLLSKKSNQRKGSLIEGVINKIPFRVLECRDANNKIYGVMRILIEEEWLEVEKTLLD